MILDAESLAEQNEIRCDFVVVGSGPAGLPLAIELGRAGFDVVVAEAGGGTFDKVGQDDAYRASMVSPESHGPVHFYRRRAFGGTTAIWGGRCIPLDEIDFERRPERPYSGWPFPYQELSAFYPAAMRVLDAGEAYFSAAQIALSPEQVAIVNDATNPDLDLTTIERFSKPTNIGRKFEAELAKSTRMRCLLHANVVEILVGSEAGEARGVLVSTRRRKTFRIIAPTVVLAAGGIETVRLLLVSQSARQGGVGNDRDLVGRFYMAHLEGTIGRVHFEKIARVGYERSSDGVYWRRLIRLSKRALSVHRLLNFMARPHHETIADPSHRDPVLSAMFLVKGLLVSEYARKMSSFERAAFTKPQGNTAKVWGQHALNVLTHLPSLARFGASWVKLRNLAERKVPSVVIERADQNYVIEFNAEQSPDPLSRIMLSDERDYFGMRRIQVDWRTSDDDRLSIKTALQVMANAFNSGSAARVNLPEDIDERVAAATRIGGHHLGAARIGTSPEHSVADSNCQVWQHPGLFLCGSATFPTAGVANPTLSIVAMSLRLAKYLISQRKY